MKYNGLFVNIKLESVKNRVIVVGSVGLEGTGEYEDGVLNRLFGENGELFLGYHYSAFNNYGERIDICAPGEMIYSTIPGSDYSDIAEDIKGLEKEYWNGTSMATPHVSGVAAMCFSVNPSLTGEQVKRIICESAVEYIRDTNRNLTFPMLNAKAAVAMAKETVGDADSYDGEQLGMIEGVVYYIEKGTTAPSGTQISVLKRTK